MLELVANSVADVITIFKSRKKQEVTSHWEAKARRWTWILSEDQICIEMNEFDLGYDPGEGTGLANMTDVMIAKAWPEGKEGKETLSPPALSGAGPMGAPLYPPGSIPSQIAEETIKKIQHKEKPETQKAVPKEDYAEEEYEKKKEYNK